MVMVSHNLPVISFMCDRIAAMQGGRLLETVETAELRCQEFQHPYSQQLFRASSGYDRSPIADLWQGDGA